MTRHGRNATNSAVYTYHERAKDAKASGFGSETRRLHKDSIKGFDCCSLTLQPCRNPVITPHGWIYDKEAILKYILDKKQEYQKKVTAFEAQRSREFKELQAKAKKDEELHREHFEEREKSISSTEKGKKDAKQHKLASFWVPNLTPGSSTEEKLQRPDKTVLCPMSGKPLKLKNLIEIKFTLIDPDGDRDKLISKEERYKCPVTNDVLRNSMGVFVLKPTGDAVTADCVEKIIRKDMCHPLTGQKLKEEDLIFVQRGGTGYSASNNHLKATHYRPNLAIS